MAQLPEINHPYVAEMEFFKQVENIDGEAKKTRFADNQVHSPFDFYLKIKEIEDEGTVTVVFYSPTSPIPKDTVISDTAQSTDATVKEKVEPKPAKQMVKTAERSFDFGEAGKYYEYILCFDRVTELKPGVHRYAIYLRGALLYEGFVQIN